MANAEQIGLLIEALIYFKDQITSAGFTSIGFLVITLGWLLTSNDTRKFLSNHISCTNILILLICGIFVGFAFLTAMLYQNSIVIAGTLEGFQEIDSNLYQHYIINLKQVIFFDFFQFLVCAMIVRVAISLKKQQLS